MSKTTKITNMMAAEANTVSRMKIKAFAAGGVDYVTKPFQFDEVNARMETHLRLRGLQLELQALKDCKNLFMGMAAHDLRSPLAAIILMCELLIGQISHLLTEKESEFLGLILTSSEFMIGLINDLVDVSAIESGHLSLNRRMIDLRRLEKRFAMY